MLLKKIKSQLSRQKENMLYRKRLVLASPQTTTLTIDNNKLINFASNDYLGLANHPKIIEQMKLGLKKYGVGSGSSHLICGHSEAHETLEREFAQFLGKERALLFSCGFMANIGVLDALLDRGDLLLQDKLNHASLLDGGRLARSKMQRFAHGDLNHLQKLLQTDNQGNKLIASDGVFSMDGDIADIESLNKIAKKTNASLLIDEAHSFGVLGENGRGICYQHQDNPNLMVMATCGKALGTAGAVVAGSKDLIEYLIQKARSYIFTTAIPASIAFASITALKILRNSDHRRQKLTQLIKYLKQGLKSLDFKLLPSDTPIQPILLEDSKLALQISQKLRTFGVLVPAIRPPTVPEGGARLRISLSSDHKISDIDQLLEALKK